MSFWVYKCNARQHPQQVAFGDWDDFFAANESTEWGSSEWTRGLDRLNPGDLVIAHQTDRKELVGLAEVVGFEDRSEFRDVIMKPVAEIRVGMGVLKKLDNRIASLAAYRSGPIQTIYEITTADAWHLLGVAKAQAAINCLVAPESTR